MSSFGTYLLGFVILIVGLAIAAHLLTVPTTWIVVGVIILLGIGVLMATTRGKMKDPPAPPECAASIVRGHPASAESASAQNHVIDVVRAGPASGGDTRALDVQLHRPVVVEQRGDHRWPDVVRWVETAVVHGLAVHSRVMHEQQHPARRNGREQGMLRGSVRGTQQCRVLRGDQVEGPG